LNLSTPIPLSFKTERLHIRRYKLSDEKMLFDAVCESITEVFPFLPWCHPDYKFEESRDWLSAVASNWKTEDTFSFGIFNADESEFYGGCGIGRIDEHPVVNLGYWLKSSATGQGFATEATIGLARFAMEEIGLQRIEIIMSVENSASKAVAEAAGALYEGRMRNRLQLHGARHDAFMYSIIPEDSGI
jgi:ribosomal-protein-serine acetyltransferase